MSKYTVTISGDSLMECLVAASQLAAEGAFADGPAPAAPSTAPVARTRGRPPKAAAETVAAPNEAPVAAHPVRTAVSDADLKKTVIQKLVMIINANDALGRNGKQVCTDLCTQFGGKNVSAIAPEKYPQIIAAVDQALAALNEDPTA